MKLKELVFKYDFPAYCVFGALAAAVNMLAYELFYRLFNWSNVLSIILSWILAVSFAFFANRYIVFRLREGEVNRYGFFRSLLYFYPCRLASGLLNAAIMFVAVDVMALNQTLWRFVSTLCVGLGNYLVGKFFIFKRRNSAE